MTDSELLIPRSDLKKSLWTAIGLSNLVIINAARRMGKTTLMKAMANAPTDDYTAFWIDLQHTNDVGGFAAEVSKETGENLLRRHQLGLSWRQNIGYLSGLEIGPLKLPEIQRSNWKSMIQYNFESLLKNTDKNILIFFDEIPLFLHKLISANNASTAAEVLNFLRGIAESESPRIRFVYAGSLGLHHILKKIQDTIHENPPMINDAHVFKVPELTDPEGAEVAARILDSGGVEYDDDAPTKISQQCNGIPFYIRQISVALLAEETRLNSEKVDEKVREAIQDPNDVLHIEKDHFLRLRNNDYYDQSIHEHIHELLNVLATNETGELAISVLNDKLKKRGREIEDLDFILSALQQDHLLKRTEGNIVFRFSIVRRSWKFHKTVGGVVD